MYGGIEADGTKFVRAVSDGGEILKKLNIPTTTPEETLDQVFEFLDCYELKGIRIGSFGSIGINKAKNNYGYVLITPKKGWAQLSLLGAIKERYNIPAIWTTDVSIVAYGELRQGVAQGKNSRIYLTVETGIGAGVVINKGIFSGIAHPEMGHIQVKRHPDDRYEGICSYHKDCLERLVVEPSIETRTRTKEQDLPQDHPVRTIQTYYTAQILINYTLTLASEKIILGGGVMNQSHLLQKIRQRFVGLTGGYTEAPQVGEYIVRWGLPNESGIIGGLLLAEHEHQEQADK